MPLRVQLLREGVWIVKDWTVEVHRETGRTDLGEDALDGYVDTLAVYSAAVSATPQGRVVARLTLTAKTPADAVKAATSSEGCSLQHI